MPTRRLLLKNAGMLGLLAGTAKAQTMIDLAQRDPIGIRELQLAIQLRLRMRFSVARYSFRANSS